MSISLSHKRNTVKRRETFVSIVMRKIWWLKLFLYYRFFSRPLLTPCRVNYSQPKDWKRTVSSVSTFPDIYINIIYKNPKLTNLQIYKTKILLLNSGRPEQNKSPKRMGTLDHIDYFQVNRQARRYARARKSRCA